MDCVCALGSDTAKVESDMIWLGMNGNSGSSVVVKIEKYFPMHHTPLHYLTFMKPIMSYSNTQSHTLYLVDLVCGAPDMKSPGIYSPLVFLQCCGDHSLISLQRLPVTAKPLMW